MKRNSGGKFMFSNAPRTPTSESRMQLLKSMAAPWVFLAPSRAGEANDLAAGIVKSLAVLSVKDKSPGNCEEKTAHNSRLANAMPVVRTNMLR